MAPIRTGLYIYSSVQHHYTTPVCYENATYKCCPMQASLCPHLLQRPAAARVLHQGEDERPAHEGHQGVQGPKARTHSTF